MTKIRTAAAIVALAVLPGIALAADTAPAGQPVAAATQQAKGEKGDVKGEVKPAATADKAAIPAEVKKDGKVDEKAAAKPVDKKVQ